MLEQTLRKYRNRAIEALAIYDALERNDRAVKVLGDETLRGSARTLVETVWDRRQQGMAL